MRNLSGILVMLALLTGCSTTRLNNQVETQTLDADDRAIIVNSQGLTCAEPSPDAMKNVAASINAQATGYGGVNESYGATMAALGLRTEGVEILRDLGYRACEAFANHGFDSSVYEGIVVNANLGVVSLMAIENLTGGKAATDGASKSQDAAAAVACSVVQIVREVAAKTHNQSGADKHEYEAAAACLPKSAPAAEQAAGGK